jgi:hypothetical protein
MRRQRLTYDERLERQYVRLGTRNPICVGCGERNPFCLELHHLGGQKHHQDISIVCRNCHRKLTDQQQDHAGGEEAARDSRPETIGRYLLGLCDLLALILATLREFGRCLIDSYRGRPA